jgi:hypothetical protein
MGILLNDSEQAWFDNTAVEVTTLAGVDNTVLWNFVALPIFERPCYPDVSGCVPYVPHAPQIPLVYPDQYGPVDTLYGEPNPHSKHFFPFKVLGWFEAPTQTQEASDQGLNVYSEGRFYFVRKDLENNKVPQNENGDRIKTGDIVQMFKKGKFWYFDLKNVERTGWVTDSETWTHYVCDIIRREDFIPERKIYTEKRRF